MADIKQNSLGLGYNQSLSIQEIHQDDIDLTLTPAGSATVHGTVTDGKNPIVNATVELFDSKGLPFQHTLTDDQGEYSMDGVPAGTYSIGAVQKGFLLGRTVGVTLSENDTAQVDFVCTPDQTLVLGAIAGVLTAGEQGEHNGNIVPLPGAKITLSDDLNNVVATTHTEDDGAFVFFDVPDGKYTLRSFADGYLPASPMTATIIGGSIANIPMSMNVDNRTYNGTVSGIIRDNNGLVVADCFVGLYQIVKQENGTQKNLLVATTKTNDAGKYLFGTVNEGQYLVKAKKNK